MASPALASSVKLMRMRTIFFLVVFASFAVPHASSAEQRSYDIMVEEGGKPLKKGRKAIEQNDGEVKKRPKQKVYPRGSGYIPSAGLPRTEAITIPQSPGVYKPPPINSFGDRVTNCIHSFPLNAGIGNNPRDQQAYIRQCAN